MMETGIHSIRLREATLDDVEFNIRRFFRTGDADHFMRKLAEITSSLKWGKVEFSMDFDLLHKHSVVFAAVTVDAYRVVAFWDDVCCVCDAQMKNRQAPDYGAMLSDFNQSV